MVDILRNKLRERSIVLGVKGLTEKFLQWKSVFKPQDNTVILIY